MASHPQPSPGGPLQVNGYMQSGMPPPQKSTQQLLASLNEATWLQIGNLTEMMGDLEGARHAYEQCLRFNQYSIAAMNAISCVLRTQEEFSRAVEYLQQILKLDATNGEVWGSLGHCYLMMEDLQQAYSAYQQALLHLQNPKEPKLWYGIGILYDRYGSLEHAEEAFSQVMRMQPDFEKANEIYFRLGIIYKQQQKYQQSLECFKYIVADPPKPLTDEDIWFQIGHVYEQQKDYDSAKVAYRHVLDRDPNHAKVLQQLGWLHHQQSNSFHSQENAIEYLEKSVSSDPSDAQSWYLLGRCYMSQQKYTKAYETYQQAVYRDGRNPTFWCSIGVLYYQINQYRDALDAYSRAIRLNPYISEVWYDLGTLYESCNNQINDALDAYQRAAELDPSNQHIKARLQLLRSGQTVGGANAPPPPHDVHPSAYQGANVGTGPPGPQWGGQSHAAVAPGPAPGLPQENDYNRRLAGIQNPAYDQRDGIRPPPAPPAAQVQRAQSPRAEQMPRYHEQNRQTPLHRGLSPSPKVAHNLPPTQQYAPQPPPPPQQQPQARIPNPNYGAPTGNILPPAANGTSAPAGPGPGPGPIPPYGRGASPLPEVRPIMEERRLSPNSTTYQQNQPYQHAPNPSQPAGIASGAPPPAAALAAAEAAARERDDRPPSAAKRMREWEDEGGPMKKPAMDENRVRPEEQYPHRPSPERMVSPRDAMRRSSSEAQRLEDQRRANENYHPSEAAHHPPTLPAINMQQPHQPPPHQQQQLPPMNEAPKEEHRDTEVPARKLDVDEDYDEGPSNEEEKKTDAMDVDRAEREKHSPPGAPNSGQSNGIVSGPPKVEPVS